MTEKRAVWSVGFDRLAESLRQRFMKGFASFEFAEVAVAIHKEESGGKMPNQSKSRKVWFVAGLGLGALAGILCAPKSGRETRKAIVAGVDDGFERLTTFGRDARKRVSNVVVSGKKLLTRKKEQVNGAIDTAKGLLKRTA